MTTLTYELAEAVPPSLTGVVLKRLELFSDKVSPLALVWFTTSNDSRERGARIDLQKQAFLDDFGEIDKEALGAEAKLVVNFVAALSTRFGVAAAMAIGASPQFGRVADPWHRKS